MKKTTLLISCVLLLLPFVLSAQGYQALYGSAYAGSTAVFNNPAAPVNAAYKWDLTLFSVQAKITTNAAYLKSGVGGRELTLHDDFNAKFVHANMDASLLNFLYKIDNTKALNFNIRTRVYAHAKTSPFKYSDDISNVHNFLMNNENAPYLQATVTHSGWLEGDLTYSQVLAENDHSKLSGGVTLQIMKGASGAFLKLNKVSYQKYKSGTDSGFLFTGGGGAFAYSAGYNGDFTKKMLTSFGLSMGLEYMTYNNDGPQNNNLNYDWKIGVSLMDLGANRFAPGSGSGELSNPVTTITDDRVDIKVHDPANIDDLRDSLNSLFVNSADITDVYRISNPTRFILNIDKNLGDNFYVNSDISLNFFSTSSAGKLHTRELNLITITPRWETIAWGAYLPLQYNTQGQLWVGAAVKLGPLVLGLHNIGILKKDALLNGGGYLLLSIHPFSKKSVMSNLDCFR